MARINPTLAGALAAGYERVAAWADILDRINVYPVPDGDTGRNLVITLGALRNISQSEEELSREILLSARGNSGNIAARFLTGFLGCKDLSSLADSARAGRDLAYMAVPNPQPGTILSLFDTLAESLRLNPPEAAGTWVDRVIQDLQETVKETTQQLRELKEAGVVDAGALGMLVFFDPLLNTLAGREAGDSLFAEEMKDSLNISENWREQRQGGYCLDVALKVGDRGKEIMGRLMAVGESVVAIPEGEFLKVHLHAVDREKAKQDLAALGSIVAWAEDNLAEQTLGFKELRRRHALHIMTDAAGSISMDAARSLGVTLLNSYVTIGNNCLPETYVDPVFLFSAMNRGIKVATSQASTAERHEIYRNVMRLHDRVLYLCVGSFYTGNYDVAMKWKADHDLDGRMTVLDTGLASGRLGLVARATAEFSLSATGPSEVIDFAAKAIRQVQEYIFLERLHFLAAGGRMSKTGAFFGDMLQIKPIISPYPDGARKMGVVRSARAQTRFAFQRMEEALAKDREATLLLEYTDNRQWLEQEIKPEIESRFPRARVILQLISLTSAVHMGPGTWGVAFLPDSPGE
ncbi:MAG: DegV family protein [Thermodesulfobacteriota bacterium]